MKYLLYPLLLILACTLTSCSEEDDLSAGNEYTNWKSRNETWFNQQMATARTAIAQAKAQYGDQWKEHSEWLILKNYTLAPNAAGATSDSIPVQILVRGQGSGCPLYTDTASICFLGRLLPTELHPQGLPFSFTGTYPSEEQVFGANTAMPVKKLISSDLMGMTTVMMNMHIGDRWRVYIHPDMAYGASATSVIPAYSVLDFTVELYAYFKPQ